jgi:hypothetical protein
MKAKKVIITKYMRVVCADDAPDAEVISIAEGKHTFQHKFSFELESMDTSVEDDTEIPFGSGDGEPDVYILPSCYASALINNDFSGLSDEDEKELDEWFKQVKPGLCVGCSSESYFTHGHDMNRNQGADVLEYYFNKPTY